MFYMLNMNKLCDVVNKTIIKVSAKCKTMWECLACIYWMTEIYDALYG